WDPIEQVATSLVVSDGTNDVDLMIPCSAMAGTTFARFRLSSAGGLGTSGPAPDGEVEDYQLNILADSVQPVITCPADVTVECDSSSASASTGVAAATDNCTASTNITIMESDAIIAGTCPQAQTINRTWTATDGAANMAACTQSITVADTTEPMITCPADVTVECDSSSASAATGVATATDNCDTNVTVAESDAVAAGACPQEETITRTWTATDDCGNSASCTQVVTVVDTTAPMITCPADVTVECNDPSDSSATGVATATDNCDTNVTIGESDVVMAGTCPQEQVITRSWNATDDCGNSSGCAQTITVEDTALNGLVPVRLSIPVSEDTFILERFPNNNAGGHTHVSSGTSGILRDSRGLFWFDLSALPPGAAINAATVSISVVGAPSGGGVNSSFGLHRSLLRWGEGDKGGNNGMPASMGEATWTSAMHNVTGWGLPGGNAGADYTAAASASTMVSGTNDYRWSGPGVTADVQTWVNTPANNYGWFLISDGEGTANSARRFGSSQGGAGAWLHLVYSAPEGIACPPDATVECSSNLTSAALGVAVAVDVCSSNVTVMESDFIMAGTCSGAWTIERTWTATDECGNSESCTQTISVVDTTVPTITCSTNISVFNDIGVNGAVVNLAVTATDNCDSNPMVVNMPASGSLFPLGTTTVNSVSTDACGNTNACSFTVEVIRPVDLAITKAGDLNPAFVHDVLTYTLTVTNQGIRTGTNIVVVDQLPWYLTYIGGGGGCTESNNYVTCNIPGLAIGASTSVNLMVDVFVPTGICNIVLTNTAWVSSFGTEQTPGDNSTTNFTDAIGKVDLVLIDDTNGWGTIAGATSGLYLVGSVFDLDPIPVHPKYGFGHWTINGTNTTNANPLTLRLTVDTTVQVHFVDLFIDVSADVQATATNWNLDFDTGIMYSDLEICNTATVDVHLIAPFWYLFPSNATQFLVNADGETNGTPYIDITSAMTNAIPLVGNMNNSLDTNECVTITNIAWYQLQAVPFNGTLMSGFFADPPGEGGGDPALRDTDRDGILNVWEQQYGLNPNHATDGRQDPDGDGQNNYQEFIADTDPGDASSLLRITGIAQTGDEAVIQWSGGQAVIQYLECAENLNGPWTPILTNAPPTVIHGLLHHPSGAAATRFYRIRVERGPVSEE
ncbi:MAG: HYR domain-containing protein, partial [Verrucomicrobiota bacterium]